MRRRLAIAGAALASLAAAWAGAAELIAPGTFSAHMIVHVTVMAVAAPLLAIAVAGSPADPTRRWPLIAAPMAAMVAELVVVWGWHLPLLHHAARTHTAALVIEQASFLAVGLALWLSVLGGRAADRRPRLAAGVIALLLTSMHMTLLGVLITLAPRQLYHHAGSTLAMVDQQVAGMVMLLGGATSYLAGGLWLVLRLLQDPSPSQREGEVGRAPLR